MLELPDPEELSAACDVLFHCAEASERGVWPDSGGIDSQSAWFVSAVKWFRRLQARAAEPDPSRGKGR